MHSHHSRKPGDGAAAEDAEEVDEHRIASFSVCWFRSKRTFGADAVKKEREWDLVVFLGRILPHHPNASALESQVTVRAANLLLRSNSSGHLNPY